MKHSKGYTLVELLVSVAIMSTITGATLVYFRYGNKNWALTRAAQKLSQDVRRASNMALSAPKIAQVDCSSCPVGGCQPKGYGVYFNSASPGTSYILFGNMDSTDPPSYDAPTGCYSADKDVIIETINIESDVKILSLVPADSFSVVFIPPDPTTKFSLGSDGTINLSLISDATKTKQITINSKGNTNIY